MADPVSGTGDSQLLATTGRYATRAVRVSVNSSKVTEVELKNIERALMNPPKKVDGWASSIGLLSSGFFAGKTLIDASWKPTGWDLFGVILAAVLFGGLLLDLFRRLRTKDAHTEAALEDVRELIRCQAAPPDA